MEKTKLSIGLLVLILILTLISLYSSLRLADKIKDIREELDILDGNFPSEKSNNQPEKDIISMDDDAVLGSRDAPVTIIEFSDYQCPYCGRFYSQTFPLIEENYIRTGKVKFIYRDFPLDGHQYSEKAAEASECAHEQGNFWEYMGKLFENQQSLDITSLKRYAKEMGMDADKFGNCLDSGRMKTEVMKDFADGQKYGVSGTPAFFINGFSISGAQPYQVFKDAIEQALNSQ